MEKVKQWKYEVIKKIESGDFGDVYKCRNLETSQKVAIKMITIQNKLEGVPSFIISKLSLLKELEHKNIVRLLDVLSSGRYLYLVFEYLDLDLHSFIRKQNSRLDPHVIKAILGQTLAGLEHYHSLKVLHRDLKPSNLLIDLKSGKVKIADFRLTTSFGVPLKEYSYMEVESSYKAPEMQIHSYEYSTPLDMWAVGCIFAEMLIGKPLFPCRKKDHLSLISRYFTALKEHSLLGKPTKETRPAVTDLRELLHSYPLGVPDLDKMLRDNSAVRLLSQMICLDPRFRITANDAVEDYYVYMTMYFKEKVPFTIPSPSRYALIKNLVKGEAKVAFIMK